MLHKDILKQLFPVELGGVFEQDLATEGAVLDAVVARAADLLKEMFPDTSAELIQAWERVCDITPPADAPIAQRQGSVVAKLRETGGLSRQYFIDLAAAMGYTIAIDEPFATDGPHVWRITFTEIPSYPFYCGSSCCGELLLDWPSQTAAEGLFQDLKPAHSRLIIAYS